MDLENLNLTPEETPEKDTPAEEGAGTEETTTEGEKVPEAPAQPEAPAEQSLEAPTFVEMPDGRKVTPQVAVEEYKRLQADYTKKSQRLAELEKPKEVEEKPWQKPGYEPQSWSEVMEMATLEATKRIKEEQESKSTQEQQARAQLDVEIATIKKTDPDVDEEAVLAFANKRSESIGITYPNFTSAYYDFKALKQHEKAVEKRVIENQKKRQADPVSTGAPAPSSGAIQYPKGADLYEKALSRLRNN